jgi:hypothetical protein
MRLIVITLVLLTVAFAGGCYADSAVRWAPSEAQRRAAEIAAKGVASLKGAVTPEAEPTRAEAQAAAEATQRYIGLADEPVAPTPVGMPTSPVNLATLAQAATDAAKPPPTAADAASSFANDIDRTANAGLGLVESILAIGATLLGTYGAVKAKGQVDAWRSTIASQSEKITATTTAIKEIVASVEQAKTAIGDPVVLQAMGDAMGREQSGETEVMVAAARAGVEPVKE